jgi:predicted component of viral defense system (DUF524 family)
MHLRTLCTLSLYHMLATKMLILPNLWALHFDIVFQNRKMQPLYEFWCQIKIIVSFNKKVDKKV